MTFRNGERLDSQSLGGHTLAGWSQPTLARMWSNLSHWQIAASRPQILPTGFVPRPRDPEEKTWAENVTQLGVTVIFDGEEYSVAIDKGIAPFKPIVSNMKMEMEYEVCGFKMEMEYQVKEFKLEIPYRLYDFRKAMDFNVTNFKIETL